MKKFTTRALSILLAVAMLFSLAITSFAKEARFDEDAYATVITASDFQGDAPAPFNRFANILTLMKNDGLNDPHSVLIGGDYSKIWPDYATPGVMQVKDAYVSVYPNANPDTVVCCQGNHDFTSVGFTKTGYYDMGAYNLYNINEDSFPWNQFLRIPVVEKNTAKKLDETLNTLIANQDNRPVIIMTHVPLHHTDRTMYGDNMHAGYLFDVINKAAEKLDIIFIFGHNHSGDYDDYIGGAVNFLAPGDTIRVPLKDKKGEDCYTEETLNFTYTNCGYVGYSGNGTENGSTNALTVGAIQFTENSFKFFKYSEDGYFCADTVERKNANTTVKDIEIKTELINEGLYEIMVRIFRMFAMLFAGPVKV